MKKILIFSISLMAFGSMMYSCNPADECKNCEIVTYNTNTNQEVSRTSATEYCGAALTAVELQDPIIIGDEKTVYECK